MDKNPSTKQASRLENRGRPWRPGVSPEEPFSRSRPQGPGDSTLGPQRLHLSKSARAAQRSLGSLLLGATESLGVERGARSPQAADGCWLQMPRTRGARWAASCQVCGPPSSASLPTPCPSPPGGLFALPGLRPSSGRLQKPGLRLLLRLYYPPRSPQTLEVHQGPDHQDRSQSHFLQMQNTSS